MIISLSEAVFVDGVGYTTPVASLPLCGANHKSASPRLCGGYSGGVSVVLTRIFTELGTDFHKIVFIRALFVLICVYCDVVHRRVSISFLVGRAVAGFS